MWGKSLWQKFLICFTLTFFAIWISTLLTWVTIYSARQEGQGSQSAPFKKAQCATLKDAVSTSPKGSIWTDGIIQTPDSKWRPTLMGKVQTPSASIDKVELQIACPSWNRDGALFIDNKLMSYSNSRGMTEDYNGIKGYPSDNLADFTIADCNNVPQLVAKFFAKGATAKYNLPSGVTAALVIKNATGCTSNPCDFEKTPDDATIAYAEPISGFDDPVTKFWQGGKKGPIEIKNLAKTKVADIQISVTSPQTIGAQFIPNTNYAALGLSLDHLILIGGKGIWTDGGKFYFTNPRDMDAKSYLGGCMNTYMGAFVSSWVFFAFFCFVIFICLVVCIARCCINRKKSAAAGGGAAAVDMEAAKPVIPVRMN